MRTASSSIKTFCEKGEDRKEPYTEGKEETPVKNVDKIKKGLPDYLRSFVVEQDMSQYSFVDHAVWRYSLRQLKNFLSEAAHECYLEGLEKTGIPVEEIPSIHDMCEKLQEFGWSALPVSGFIPPAAFMEMQSLSILPIASAIRSVDHIFYTPAPDIIHEAAGHAPILVNKDFAKYLREYATVAKKAIISKEDLRLYEAIRKLSDLKEHPDSTPEEIQKAQARLNHLAQNMGTPSEATLLGRMNWWTAEYGLIGSLEEPKAYGAGLLSSYGEVKECFKSHVKKIPLSLDCLNYNYDITECQPQLFVASSFGDLTSLLHQLSENLSYKKGGCFGLNRAIEAQTVNTLQLNSGLQVSGKVVDFIKKDGECIYYRLEGPSQLAIGGREITGHGSDYHREGFSSPLGFVDGWEDCLSWASSQELEERGLGLDQKCHLRFESGVEVVGILKNSHRTPRGELCLLSFADCHVTFKGKSLFMPDWGMFDMAVGSSIESVFGGPADSKAYGDTDCFVREVVPPRELSPGEQVKDHFYGKIRHLRQTGKASKQEISQIFEKLEEQLPQDWLSRLELVELSFHVEEGESLREPMIKALKRIQASSEPLRQTGVIEYGLAIAHKVL